MYIVKILRNNILSPLSSLIKMKFFSIKTFFQIKNRVQIRLFRNIQNLYILKKTFTDKCQTFNKQQEQQQIIAKHKICSGDVYMCNV